MLQAVASDVTIGILGENFSCIMWLWMLMGLPRPPALQGAFAEHQVILQKLSLKRKIVIILVRTVKDLEKCNGLIIPGGGM
jgi:SNO glutamine amidotransferase family